MIAGSALAQGSAARPVAKKPTAFVPATTIVWRGDIVSARGFTNDLVNEFRKEKRGLLTVQTFSTISGIDGVRAGTADIAGVARPMHEKREEERELVFQPVALDAIVPLTHPRNPVSNLTLAQLRQIYLGRINNWKELGGADAAINLYAVAAPLDGVEFSFRRLMYKRGEQKVAAPRLYLNTSKLEEAIAIDPAGLGLSTLSSSYANKGVKLMTVEGRTASTPTIADGSYPLFTTLYVTHRADAPNIAAIEDFVLFLDSPTAHAAMRRHQLVPYAEAGDIHARDGERLAFIDAAIVDVTPADVAAMPRTRDPIMSAPRATLESRMRAAPTAESTQAARENLARAEAEKAAREAERAAKSKPKP
ncbi:substrate-binding domain-containing protein [Dokdonella sp.]|uniref:substrate-binding domain-containing protein n=1 Tax=Dokdonella sp. TaxID=2291710 RepID=UPI0025C5AB9E|nr:substrate-binding domain-containing protein [Dokdonella sp.]MBX3690682.1 substrate-binding domain-containing protein [Dokdonella sp.]